MSDEYDPIKKEIVISASVDKVYSALIIPELLAQWFPNIVTIEPKISGKIFFRFLKEYTRQDKDHDIMGTIITLIPNRELSYTWNFMTRPEYNKNTIVTWKLEQLTTDKTKLTLIHSGFTNAVDYNMMIITKDGVGILKDLKILWIKTQTQTKL